MSNSVKETTWTHLKSKIYKKKVFIGLVCGMTHHWFLSANKSHLVWSDDWEELMKRERENEDVNDSSRPTQNIQPDKLVVESLLLSIKGMNAHGIYPNFERTRFTKFPLFPLCSCLELTYSYLYWARFTSLNLWKVRFGGILFHRRQTQNNQSDDPGVYL